MKRSNQAIKDLAINNGEWPKVKTPQQPKEPKATKMDKQKALKLDQAKLFEDKPPRDELLERLKAFQTMDIARQIKTKTRDPCITMPHHQVLQVLILCPHTRMLSERATETPDHKTISKDTARNKTGPKTLSEKEAAPRTPAK